MKKIYNLLGIRGFNNYDYIIIIVIATMVLGSVRIADVFGQHVFAAILCFPLAVKEILYGIRTYRFVPIVFSVFVMMIYVSLSLIWTIDEKGGFGEYLLILCNILVFIGLIHCVRFSENPIRSFLIGWIMLVCLTYPVAFWEIISDNHIEGYGDYSEGSLLQTEDGAITRKFAAVTYRNLNTYGTMLCCSLPVLFFSVLRFKRKLLPFVSSVLAVVVLLINSSRASMIVIFVVIAFFLWGYHKVDFKGKRKKTIIISAIFIVGFVAIAPFIFNQIMSRMIWYVGSGEGVASDDGRSAMIKYGLDYVFNVNPFGVGVGGMQEMYASYGCLLRFCHNLILEIMVEYGLLVCLLLVVPFFGCYVRLLRSKDHSLKTFGMMSFFSFIPMAVINDTYMSILFVWVYLATICAVAYGSASVNEEKTGEI